MFVVEVGSVLTTLLIIRDIASGQYRQSAFHRSGDAVAMVHGLVCQLRRSDGRRARQSSGRYAPQGEDGNHRQSHRRRCSTSAERQDRRDRCAQLRKGDLVLVEAGEFIPGDGEVIEGVASVDESAITGESAPVIRESAATVRPSQAAQKCFPIGSRFASRRIPARLFSTE